jgi:hypothetical protein
MARSRSYFCVGVLKVYKLDNTQNNNKQKVKPRLPVEVRQMCQSQLDRRVHVQNLQ